MSTTLVILVYGIVAVLALVLLYFSGPKAWYWHVLAAAVALAIGSVRIPVKYNTPTASLVIGSVFIFLMVWAVAAPFVRKRRR